eukprot:403354356
MQIRLRDDIEADREIEIKNALNEVRVLASIDHPNVIGYRDAFVDKDDNSLCLILEYADGGNLQEYIEFLEQKNKLMPEQEALNIFIQIILGLRALHKMRIIHRDLKTANIFLTRDKQVKIGDMNVAKVLKGQFGTTQTGTPYYAGPEIWLQSPQYLAVDIWSMGCILFEMLAYYPPYNGKDMKLLAQSIVRDPVIDIPLEYSQELNMLVKNLLQKNPLKRPTCDQILEINLVQQLFTNMPQYDQYIKEMEIQEEKKQKKYDQSKMVSTIRQPRDFYFMVKNDFPKPNFPIQEVQAPINKYENQRDDNFSLFWKSKKREKQELLKKFRFIGQDDIKVPFKKIAQYEQEKIQRLKDEDDLNEQFILKKRNHRRLQALEDGKEKQEPIFTHKVGVLIGMDSLEYKQKQENLKIIRKKMEVIKDSQDQIPAPVAFDMPYDDRLLNELQNDANEKLTETQSQKLDETSMSYKYGYRDKFLDTQNNLLAQNKQPVKVAKFRDEDRRVKLNMFQALNIGIKLRNMKEKEIDQNIDIKQDFDNIIAKRDDEDLLQSQKLSNLMEQQQQKKRAKSRTFQNKHSVTFIQPEQQQDNRSNNIQRNISPFIKSAQNVLNNNKAQLLQNTYHNNYNSPPQYIQNQQEKIDQYKNFREMSDHSSNIVQSIQKAYQNQKPVYYNVKKDEGLESRNYAYSQSNMNMQSATTRSQSQYNTSNRSFNYGSDNYGQRLNQIERNYIF